MRLIRPLTVLLGVTLTAGLSGCASTANTQAQRDAERVRKDPTPEAVTLFQTPDEVENELAVMYNDNWRMFKQDLGRAFYVDRPSRLTREPVPR